MRLSFKDFCRSLTPPEHTANYGGRSCRYEQLLTNNSRGLFWYDGCEVVRGFFGSYLDGPGDDFQFERVVSFHLSKPPVDHVQGCIVNSESTYIALYSSSRITIVTLPKEIWISQTIRNWDDSYICGCEMLQCGSSSVSHDSQQPLPVLQVSWHPQSIRHLYVLYADNTIRVYDVSSSKYPQNVVHLSELEDSTPGGSTLGCHSFRASLGEVAESFDFGLQENKAAAGSNKWPIYVLYGSGDVYCVISDIACNRFCSITGPLLVRPAAEDNYGTDGCDMILLRNAPLPILVIATATGLLYHCILLEDTALDELNPQSPSDRQPILHVCETIDLQLDNDLDVKRDYRSGEASIAKPIVLVRDSTNPCRYYVSHSSGIHSVTLTWISRLVSWTKDSSCEDCVPDTVSIVEHVVCTRVPGSSHSDFLAVHGLSVVSSGLSNAQLICVFEDNTPFISDVSRYQDVSGALRHEDAGAGNMATPVVDTTTPSAQLSSDFMDYISTILSRNNAQPALKFPVSNKGTVVANDSLDLVLNCLSLLKEEYIDRLKLAREECERRVTVLKTSKDQSASKLVELLRLIKDVSVKNVQQKQRLEALKRRHIELDDRLERLLTKARSGSNVISEAEEDMYEEIKSMNITTDALKSKMKKLKELVDVLQAGSNSKNEEEGSRDAATVDVGFVTSQQAEHFRTLLQEQNQQIEALVFSLSTTGARISEQRRLSSG